MEWLAKGINITILLLIVYFFMRKKISAYFAQQREELQEKMSSAKVEFEKVRKNYEELEQQMGRLDEHLSQLKIQSKEDLQREADRVRQDAEIFSKKIVSDAQLRMDQEVEKAKQEFTRELLDSAVSSARAELASQLNKKDEAWTGQLVTAGLDRERRGQKNYAS